jgi:hypothetical protein
MKDEALETDDDHEHDGEGGDSKIKEIAKVNPQEHKII